jgi:predicted nucleic acid-binding Zn ribbon protein
MHGWQHQFVTKDPGMLKVNQYSEFAGLPRAEQERKLRAGSAIFNREGIESDVWIAPAHSFDAITIELLLELGFRYISDGFHLLPHIDKVGMMWIPQQLWGFRWRPFGVWTICFHITTWTAADIAAFKENTKRYRTAISSFDEVVQRFGNRRGTVLDDPAAHIYRSMTKSASQLKRQANRVSSVIHGNGFTDREKGREKESSGKVSPSAS